MSGNADKLIVGLSPAMAALRSRVRMVARTNMSVLIEGPTGAGKELVAAALHAESGRKGKFVAFNVCAIADSMFEDAVFGHVRGSFTGAVADNAGFLSEANGGTLFLDEISGLPTPQQAKLLRAIETGEYRPVGGRHDLHSDARVVAASNESIQELVAERRFRGDLAHRLAAVLITVPSLDERPEDIPALVQHFLTLGGYSKTTVTDGALRILRKRNWPGNIRELKHVVDWVAVFCAGLFDEGALEAALHSRFAGTEVRPDADAARRRVLRDALDRHDWNIGRTANALRMHRTTLYRQMRRLRLVDASDVANVANGSATNLQPVQPTEFRELG